MKIKIIHIYIFLLMSFLGCEGELAPKAFEMIPEDLTWKLEKKYSDASSKIRIAVVSHYTLDKENMPFIKLATQNHGEYAKKYKYDYFFRNGTIQGTEKFRSPTAKNRTFQLGLYWQKIQAISDLLELKKDGKYVYDYVFWIDTDAIFTNMDQTLEELIEKADKDTYFFVAEDILSSALVSHTCINAGVFMIKNSQKGRDFINNVSRAFPLYEKVRLPEQAAMQDLAFGYLNPADIDKIAHDKDALDLLHSQTLKRDCSIRPKDGVKLYIMRFFNSGYPWEFERTKWGPQSFTAHFLTLNGVLTSKYMEPLLDCLKKNNYQNREKCTPEKLNIALKN